MIKTIDSRDGTMRQTRWGTTACALLLLAGCGPGGDSGAIAKSQRTSVTPPADLGPQQVLRRLLDTYRQAQSYADDAVVRLRYVEQGRPVEQEWRSSVRFARPNRLALDAFQAMVRCDGEEFKARIEDEPTGNIDN